MAQINSCLKGVFTGFNIFFAVVGGLILGLTLLAHVMIVNHGGQEINRQGLLTLYIVGAATMVIAIVGACGALRESRVCLIVFLVAMVLASLITLSAGIPSAIARPQLERVLHDKLSEMLPLDVKIKSTAAEIQKTLHCCGLFSYRDWEDHIPDSCLCSQSTESSECQWVNQRASLFPTSIYSQPCFPIIAHYVLLAVDVVIGLIFSLAFLAVLGVTLSSIMIHQMSYPVRPATTLTVPTIFSMTPPKYQELQNNVVY